MCKVRTAVWATACILVAATAVAKEPVQNFFHPAGPTGKTSVVAQAAWGVQGIAFNPDGTRMAVMGSMGANLQIFRANGLVSALPRPRLVVDQSLAFLDEHRLVRFPTLDSPPDALVDITNTDTPDQRRTIVSSVSEGPAHRSMAKKFCVSGDRRLIAAVQQFRDLETLVLVDSTSYAVRSVGFSTLLHPLGIPLSMACSDDASIVALGLTGGRVSLVETARMTMKSAFTAFSSATATGVAAISISPDGTMIATGPSARFTAAPLPDHAADPRNGMGVKLWRTADGAFLRTDDDIGTVRQMAWSADSRQLAIARDDRVTVLDAKTGRKLADVATRGTFALTTAPDGRSFVFGDGNLVQLLRVE